jgi:hypothetical protein
MLEDEERNGREEIQEHKRGGDVGLASDAE